MMKNNTNSIGEKVNERENLRFSSHKGISLSIEVVVILILAVIVLAVVLFLFMGAGSRGQNEIQARFEQSRWCQAYVQIDPECKSAEVDLTVAGAPQGCQRTWAIDPTRGGGHNGPTTLRRL